MFTFFLTFRCEKKLWAFWYTETCEISAGGTADLGRVSGISRGLLSSDADLLRCRPPIDGPADMFFSSHAAIALSKKKCSICIFPTNYSEIK